MTDSKRKFLENLGYMREIQFEPSLESFDNRSPKHQMYGRIDSNGKSIAPLNHSAIEQIPGTEISALNFVVDAFVEFSAKYERLSHPIEGIPIIVAQRGYVNPLELYDRQLENLFSVIYSEYILPRKDSIKSLDQFVEVVLLAIKDYSHQSPVTYSRFVKSGLCPIHGTGLVIELMKASHSVDGIETKLKIINSPSFDAYANLAAQHGFSLMAHAPWALVANIKSRQMLEYASQYVGVESDIQSSFYYNCRGFDLDKIKYSIGSWYDLLTAAHGETATYKICKDGSLLRGTTITSRTPASAAVAAYGDKKWFQLYVKILVLEEKINIPKTKLDRLLENCYSLLIKEGFERSMDYVERKILEIKTDIYR